MGGSGEVDFHHKRLDLLNNQESNLKHNSGRHSISNQISSPDRHQKQKSSQTMLSKFLHQKKLTKNSSMSVGNLLVRNKTPRSVVHHNRRLLQSSINPNITNDNIQAESNLDIASTRRKKSLLYKEGNKSTASLDASMNH